MSKIGFSNYVFERLTGFGGRVGIEGDDLLDFPGVAGAPVRTTRPAPTS